MKEAATNESKEQDCAFVQSKIIVGAEVKSGRFKIRLCSLKCRH